jgi:hypothetical protein
MRQGQIYIIISYLPCNPLHTYQTITKAILFLLIRTHNIQRGNTVNVRPGSEAAGALKE